MYLLSLAWDSLLPVKSLKVTLYHAVFIPISFQPPHGTENPLKVWKASDSGGEFACGGEAGVHINVFITITCIIKAEMENFDGTCQEHKHD